MEDVRRTVLITGCSSGIGRALCYVLHRKLDRKGTHIFRVFATARQVDALQQLREDGIEVAACDVTSTDSITACAADITARAGAVHVLINNAGMQATGPVVEQPLEHFQRVLDTNCTGAVRMVQAVVPAMLRQGGGLVVNVCSVSSYVDLPLSAAYCASKAALLSATNVARMELEPLGVSVMAVTAGVIESDIARKALSSGEQRCDSGGSAYHSVANALVRRMDIPMQSGRVMPAEEAAEAIAAAIMRPTPPREIVTGARVRTALLAGFIQKWVWPSFVERKFMTMFGLSELGKQAV